MLSEFVLIKKSDAMTDNLNPDSAEQCAVYLKALADPTRLRILRALQPGPLTVSDIAMALEIEIGLVSHHLRTLFHAQVTTTHREGRYIYYSLNHSFIKRRGRAETFDFGCCQFQLADTQST